MSVLTAGRLKSASGTYQATALDSVIVADATSAAFTITLPTAVGFAGKRILIRRTNAGSNAVTIAGNGAQTIGTGGATSFKLLSRNALLEVVSDGTNWQIVNRRDILNLTRRADAIRTTGPEVIFTTSGGNAASGTLNMFGIELLAGDVLTGGAFMSGSTPASAPTHWLFMLYGTDGVTLLKQTADQLTAAWGASTPKKLDWTGGTYTVPLDGLYYLSEYMVATTVRTLRTIATTSDMLSGPPMLHGTADAGLTGTAPSPAAAMTVAGSMAYGFVY